MFEPENEMGVVFLFAQMLYAIPWELVSIQSHFPDAQLRYKPTSQIYRVEFEYLASNFVLHEHNPKDCDIIICWDNDLGNLGFPIWEMKERFFEFGPPEDLESLNSNKELLFLRIENKVLKRRLRYENGEDVSKDSRLSPTNKDEILGFLNSEFEITGEALGVSEICREITRKRIGETTGFEKYKGVVSETRKDWMREKKIGGTE